MVECIRFFIQINADLWLFLFIKESRKKCTQLFEIVIICKYVKLFLEQQISIL